MKAALYARVSTRDKDQNPESQLLPLRAFCKDAGWEIYREYVDHARAKDYKRRAAWTELKKDANMRRFKVVLVFRLNRAFRHAKECLNVVEEWFDFGIGFKSYCEGVIDTTTPHGKLVLTILAAVAELESATTGENVKSGIARRIAEGGTFGRKPLAIPSQTIREAITQCNGSRSAAAKILGCSVPYIYKILGPIKPSQNPAKKSDVESTEKEVFTREVFYEAP